MLRCLSKCIYVVFVLMVLVDISSAVHLYFTQVLSFIEKTLQLACGSHHVQDVSHRSCLSILSIVAMNSSILFWTKCLSKTLEEFSLQSLII